MGIGMGTEGIDGGMGSTSKQSAHITKPMYALASPNGILIPHLLQNLKRRWASSANPTTGTARGFRVWVVKATAVIGTAGTTRGATGTLAIGEATATGTITASLDTPHHEQNLASSGIFIPQDEHVSTISTHTQHTPPSLLLSIIPPSRKHLQSKHREAFARPAERVELRHQEWS